MIDTKQLLPNISRLEDYKKESLYELMKVPEIKQFITSHQIPYTVYSDYWSELLEYKEYLDNGSDYEKILTYQDGKIIIDYHDTSISDSQEYTQYIVYNNLSTKLLLQSLKENKYVRNFKNLSTLSKRSVIHLMNYTQNKTDRTIYLKGDASDKKTELMTSFMNELMKKHKKIGVIHFPTFLLDLKASFSSDDRLLNEILDIPYLLIDSLGEENVTSWSRDEILLTILSYRSINHYDTFITSQYDLEDLKLMYKLRYNDDSEELKAERIVAKIKSMMDIEEIE